MSDLNDFQSHQGKPLYIHTDGVFTRVRERTQLPVALVSARVHDVGKVNPNFQQKLDPQGKKPSGDVYSSHAYLSAVTYLHLPVLQRKQLLQSDSVDFKLRNLATTLIIARHHGHLTNLSEKVSANVETKVTLRYRNFLNESEMNRLKTFLETNPDVLLAAYASFLLMSEKTFVIQPIGYKELEVFLPSQPVLLPWEKALDFFLETQFAFAALLESDKRDAGNNSHERRRTEIVRLKRALETTSNLKDPESEIESLPEDASLNDIRTHLRHRSVAILRHNLQNSDKRVFCLTAPTGAGKTFTLLALAREILRHRNAFRFDSPINGVIYGLPFLSITEQVEKVCNCLIKDPAIVLRCDSRARYPNIEKLMEDVDKGDIEAQAALLKADFATDIFDCPLTITTFVQFFETLMSNRNATLLKLPNFSRSIILLDEIQAMPPRLYTFFAAYLDAFCRKFDSYVIFSTATMPSFNLPEPIGSADSLKLRQFFPDYQAPEQLLESDCFNFEVFNRYQINPIWEVETLEQLAENLRTHRENEDSVLVVLNTIADTRTLYALLDPEQNNPDIVLLNTRFTLGDRRKKIDLCSNRTSPRIIITTQLIEAGVDIDFPIVYRDLCPFPNLIQTAGRCNRNGTYENGIVYLIGLTEKAGRTRASRVYTEVGNWYLEFTKEAITAPVTEMGLLGVQQRFFQKINQNLRVGDHPNLGEREGASSNLVLCVRDAAFEDAGCFRLIPDGKEQFTFYVPQGNQDKNFEVLQKLIGELQDAKKEGFAKARIARIKVETHLRTMSVNMVEARISEANANILGSEEAFGIRLLANKDNYTPTFGLEVARDDNIL